MLAEIIVSVIFGLGHGTVKYSDFVSVDDLDSPLLKVSGFVVFFVVAPFLVIEKSIARAHAFAVGVSLFVLGLAATTLLAILDTLEL